MNPLKTKWLPQLFKKQIDMGVIGFNFFSTNDFFMGLIFFQLMNFFTHLFSTYDLCGWAILTIFLGGTEL